MQALSLDKVAALALNTQALGIKSNLERILKAVHEALEQGKSALFVGELCVTGAECEDMFLSPNFIAKAKAELLTFQEQLPADFIVGLGLPQVMQASCFGDSEAFLAATSAMSPENESEESSGSAGSAGSVSDADEEDGPLASSYVLLSKDEIIFTAPSKLKMEFGRTDYSTRYFYQAYEFPGFDVIKGYVAQVGGQKILLAFGDKEFFVGPEMQEYMAEHHDEFAFILMSECYGYEVEKSQLMEQEALTLSQIYDLPVVRVNNLGCEGGATIYDGQCLFIDKGEVVARNKLFSFKPYELVTTASKPMPAIGRFDEMLTAVSLGLHDWMCKTHSKGFALSLSGGADSALCATCVVLSQIKALLDLGLNGYMAELKSLGIAFDEKAFGDDAVAAAGVGPYDSSLDSTIIDNLIAVLKKHIVPKILVCAYQGSDYSGAVTRTAATKMAECLGATFYQWSISKVVKDYVDTLNGALGYELNWDNDDIALQNIQARSRLPSIWLLANHKNFLLIATSNLSEAAVGYCTMDGDTAGGLSPIAGIGKSTILQINKHIMHDGIALDGFAQRFKVDAMSYIVAQAPTAELRPGGEQTDEKDLMPYPLLDTIRKLFAQHNLLPEDIASLLIAHKDDEFKNVTTDLGVTTAEDIERCVARFFRFFQRNQWKRERYATGFHIEKDDSSAKSYMRFPVLSATLL